MLLIVIGIYVIAVSLTSLLWRNPAILALCFIFISLLMLFKWHTKSDLFFYFTAFTLGPIAEMVNIYNGVWKYSKSDFLIPIWLPFGWGIAILIIKKLSDTILKKE
jgi:hypothetical protein